jgi:hypothetical protein
MPPYLDYHMVRQLIHRHSLRVQPQLLLQLYLELRRISFYLPDDRLPQVTSPLRL